MKKNNKIKPIPKFKNEDEEREFWATHDLTDYFDFSRALKLKFPNLKFSTKPITIRITHMLLDNLKMIANRKDVPYQSLIKVWLHEKVKEELKK